FDAILYVPPPSSWRGVFHVVNTASWPQKIRNPQPEKIASITDGTSNTIAFGEYASRTPASFAQKFWGYGRNQYPITVAMIPQATRLPDYAACAAAENNDGSGICRFGAFASFHPGGACVGFCDGSARFLSTNLDGRVLMSLATVA